MANYYQVQRNTATKENHTLMTVGGKCVAVIQFYMPKHGGINAWEFTGTKEVAVESGEGATSEESSTKEVAAMPINFKAYMFSCAQAFIDFMKTKFNKVIDTPLATRTIRGVSEAYWAPDSYTGNPFDYIIIGGPSQRDSEYDADFPVPNHVTISYAHGDRPYYNEDGERFWDHDDLVPYFSVIVFDNDPKLKKLVSTIYYT